MAFLGSFGKWFENAIPNEVKSVVSNIIPNEVKPYIAPIIKDYDKEVAAKQAETAAAAAATVSPTGGAPQYDDTLLKAFNAQLAIEPKLLEANKLYQPQWLELQKQIQASSAKNQMDLMGQLYPQAGTIEAAYQNQLRQAELQQLTSNLPAYQQAVNALTPGYASAVAGMGQLAQQAASRAGAIPNLTAYEQRINTPYGNAPGATGNALTALQKAQAGTYMGAVGNPALSSGLNTLNNRSTQQYVAAMPGMQRLAAQMGMQANQELAAGRNLTPEEERMAQQSARAAYAARGTALGNQAVTAEILNRADLANQRYQQRIENASRMAGNIQNIYQPALAQSFARQQGAEQYNLGAQQQAYQQAMGKEALLSSTQQAAFNQALQRSQAEQQRLQSRTAIQAGQAQLAAGAMGQLQAAQAPVLQAYYRQPILQQTVGQAQTMGLANQQASGNTLFQPESSLAFQSAFLPYQSNIALQQAQIMADASKSAGKSSLTGNLAGSIIPLAASFLFCWVAREVYGTKTGTWKVFRSWMLEKAPEWLRNAYIKYGPQVAVFISDKPVLKSIIRRWMDSKIESYLTA